MLVRALCLRSDGVPLSKGQLRAAAPLVGWLSYQPSVFGGRDRKGTHTAMLMPIEGTEPLVHLFKVRIKIERRGILISGEEEAWRRRQATYYRQTLWAWPISPDETRHANTTTTDPYLLEDERAAIGA